MVRLGPVKDGVDVADDAEVAGVVLTYKTVSPSWFYALRRKARTRARLPDPAVRDVHLARGVVEAEEHARQDGDRVLLVVDVRERGDVRVDVVRKVLVPDLGMRWGQRVREEQGEGARTRGRP